MNKVIKDGRVAILYSPSYGAGWYSWNTRHPELIYMPEIVKLVQKKKDGLINISEMIQKIDELIELKYEKNEVYTGGSEDLDIAWLPEGTSFNITDYDGFESINLREEINWQIA